MKPLLKKIPDDVSREVLPKGIVHYQPKRGAKTGTDTLLLSSFVQARPGRPSLELGSGSGLATLLLAKAGMNPAIGLEIQPEFVKLSKMSAVDSQLYEARFLLCDIREHMHRPPHRLFAVVLANPPYYRIGEGKISPDPSRALSRHELTAALSDFICMGANHLAPDGELDMILPATRLQEALGLARRHGLEPETVVEVCAMPREPAGHYLLRFCLAREYSGGVHRRKIVLHMPDGTPSCALDGLDRKQICPQLY